MEDAMQRVIWTAGIVLGVAGVGAAEPDLMEPFAVSTSEAVVDVEIGHASPFLADMDGDGLSDLLVGQFGGGKVRVFRNIGTRGAPAFAPGAPVLAEGEEATVPAG
jgi:hypothetical protein